MPFLGRGRWTIPVNLLKNRELKKRTQTLARQLQHEVEQAEATGNATHNPQAALKTFKTRVVDLYRNHQKANQPRLTSTINNLQQELQNKADTPGITEEGVQEETALLRERIEALERKRRDNTRMMSSARNRLEGEIMSKHWVRSARENTPRDTIRALRNPLQQPSRTETRSDRMAQIAKEYLEQLLAIDRDPNAEPDEGELDKVLGNIDSRLSVENVEKQRECVSDGEVTAALADSANDKAAGLDGIPMELWKLLHQQYKSAEEKEQNKFSEGWMCPIYKKKEADNAVNYRPTTVLNTDYKFFTKAIATRLAEVAPSVIHPYRAGFIRGRSTFDQVEQAATAINYARLKSINGAIVALDQEKSYDKITHPYLWGSLENLPSRRKLSGRSKPSTRTHQHP